MIGWLGFHTSVYLASQIGLPDRWTICAYVGLCSCTGYVFRPAEKLIDHTIGRFCGHSFHCRRALYNAIDRGTREGFKRL